jgi:hypothetical protein
MKNVDNKSLANGKEVKELKSLLYESEWDRGHGYGAISSAIGSVIESGAWKNYYSENGEEVWTRDDSQFKEWIEASPPGGLASSIPRLKEICSRSPETLWKLEQAIEPMGKNGVRHYDKDSTYDMAKVKSGSNGRDYIISRLKRDAPEIAEQVIQHELSAQAGKRQAIELGLWVVKSSGKRKKRLSIDLSQDLEVIAKDLIENVDMDKFLKILNLYLTEHDQQD